MRAAQVMLDSYSALVSGVLIGMSEGLQSGKAAAAPAAAEPRCRAARRRPSAPRRAGAGRPRRPEPLRPPARRPGRVSRPAAR